MTRPCIANVGSSPSHKLASVVAQASMSSHSMSRASLTPVSSGIPPGARQTTFKVFVAESRRTWSQTRCAGAISGQQPVRANSLAAASNGARLARSAPARASRVAFTVSATGSEPALASQNWRRCVSSRSRRWNQFMGCEAGKAAGQVNAGGSV